MAWLAYPRLRVPAAASLGLLLAAIASGGLVAWSDDAAWAAGLHVGAAACALAATVVTVALSLRGERLPFGSRRDYVTLTKPTIMALLLITGAAGMFVGAGGWPGATELGVMLLGLALACGGASALNHVMDADIDRLMGERTARRPVASGRVPAPRALEFGLALSALSFAVLASAANVLTAVLALVGGLFYVIVYTGWLKRSTDQNIVIGGAAGAVPPLVGYAAATGSLGVPALALFGIVFLWTPPHFWALALMIKEHYARAGVPMLPVSRGDRETLRQIVLYSLVLVGVHARRRPVARPGVHGCGGRARRLVPGSRPEALAQRRARRRSRAVPLLARLPGAAVRRRSRRPAARLMLDPDLARRNNRLGLALLGLFLLLFAGTVLVALVYLQLD